MKNFRLVFSKVFCLLVLKSMLFYLKKNPQNNLIHSKWFRFVTSFKHICQIKLFIWHNINLNYLIVRQLINLRWTILMMLLHRFKRDEISAQYDLNDLEHHNYQTPKVFFYLKCREYKVSLTHDFLYILLPRLGPTAGVPDLPFAGGSHSPKTWKIKKKIRRKKKEIIIHTPIQTHICSFTP